MSDTTDLNLHRDASGEVSDRYGRPLKVGDVVYLPGKGDTAWTIQTMRPVVDPRLPPGLIHLQLAAVLLLGMKKHQADPELIKVRDRDEVKAARLEQAPPEGGIA